MPPNDRRRPGLELGVILLLSEIFNVGLGSIPRVTLFTIVGQVLLYLGVINVPWSKWDVCISADTILKTKDYRRFIFSTFEHGDDMHLYYNMISFLVKGRTLEKRYGSSNFLGLLALLVLLTNSIYVALAKYGSEFLDDYSMMRSCAIGFSGVLFALKVITTAETGPGVAYIAGIQVPSKYAAWVELVAIHLLVPNASFLGHLAGILAGCLYTSTFLGRIMDNLISSVTGWPMLHQPDEGYQSSNTYSQSYQHQGTNNFGAGGYQYGPTNRNGGFGSFLGPNVFRRTYTNRDSYGWR